MTCGWVPPTFDVGTKRPFESLAVQMVGRVIRPVERTARPDIARPGQAL